MPTLDGRASACAVMTGGPHDVSMLTISHFIFYWRTVAVVGGVVKLLSPVWVTWVQSLSQEDPLEKGMAANTRILAWRVPWTEEPGRPQSTGPQRAGHD